MKTTQAISRLFNGVLCPLPGIYVFDSVHTFAEFTAQHLIVGHVRGRFDKITGQINIPEDPRKSFLKVSIDTNSISTNNAKRDEDLRSERFFHVKKYPHMTYQSDKFTVELDGQMNAEGNLTIRDKTVHVPLCGRVTGIITDSMGNIRVGFQANAKTSRAEFNLLANLEKENGGIA